MINLDLEGNEVEIRRKGTKEIKKTIGKKKHITAWRRKRSMV